MLFLFPSRLQRLSYFLRSIVLSLASLPLSSLVEEREAMPLGLPDLWLAIPAVAIVIYWIAYVVRPRCKDAGMRWGWSFLMLVPLVNIGFGLILLFSTSKLPTEETKA